MPKEHKVKQGDCISSISYEHGFFPETLWNDPANAQLKKIRKDPNILIPGDVVVIPDKRLKEIGASSSARHRFKKKGVPEKFRLKLLRDGKPRVSVAFRLDIDGALKIGQTNGCGMIETVIPPNAKKGLLIVTEEGQEDEEYELNLGYLDPITEISGVQMRLHNLEYYCGDMDGILNQATREAIVEFQRRNGLNPSGQLDEITLQKLEEIHGS